MQPSLYTHFAVIHAVFSLVSVVESIMRGEDVGITPRRSRSAVLQTQQQQPVCIQIPHPPTRTLMTFSRAPDNEITH